MVESNKQNENDAILDLFQQPFENREKIMGLLETGIESVFMNVARAQYPIKEESKIFNCSTNQILSLYISEIGTRANESDKRVQVLLRKQKKIANIIDRTFTDWEHQLLPRKFVHEIIVSFMKSMGDIYHEIDAEVDEYRSFIHKKTLDEKEKCGIFFSALRKSCAYEEEFREFLHRMRKSIDKLMDYPYLEPNFEFLVKN